MRRKETSAERVERLEADKARKASARSNETSSERDARLAARRAHEAAARQQENAAQRETRLAARRAQEAAARQQETDEDREARLAPMRARNRQVRTHVQFKDAMRSREILLGLIEVPQLHETEDYIGSMDHECPDCGALKFRRETPSTCCSGGKIHLTAFPPPPAPLMELFIGENEDARIFHKHARALNNAVCLTSLKNHWKPRPGFQPSVIFQGRIQTRVGPLLPADGDNPIFAQLYIHDPAMESTNRFNSMSLPSDISIQERTVLQDLLHRIQSCLHEVNPFIQDFKQIMEISDADIAHGKLVISAKAPTGEHARRYNTQTNLKEVFLLTVKAMT